MKTRGRGPASQPQREAKLIISKLYPACFLKKKKKKEFNVKDTQENPVKYLKS